MIIKIDSYGMNPKKVAIVDMDKVWGISVKSDDTSITFEVNGKEFFTDKCTTQEEFDHYIQYYTLMKEYFFPKSPYQYMNEGSEEL